MKISKLHYPLDNSNHLDALNFTDNFVENSDDNIGATNNNKMHFHSVLSNMFVMIYLHNYNYNIMPYLYEIFM